MNIISFFSDSGIPKTGLSPTIDIYKLDGTKVVNGDSMSEVGGGFYKYDFSGYDEKEEYCIIADGGNTLSNTDRYMSATNETAGVRDLLKVQKNKWELVNNQFIIYDDDGSELYKFNLKDGQGKPSMKDVFKREVA